MARGLGDVGGTTVTRVVLTVAFVVAMWLLSTISAAAQMPDDRPSPKGTVAFVVPPPRAPTTLAPRRVFPPLPTTTTQPVARSAPTSTTTTTERVVASAPEAPIVAAELPPEYASLVASLQPNCGPGRKTRDESDRCWGPLIDRFSWPRSTMRAVVWCESAGDQEAIGVPTRYGTAYGIFQVLPNGSLDPVTNTLQAWAKYDARGLQPWVSSAGCWS